MGWTVSMLTGVEACVIPSQGQDLKNCKQLCIDSKYEYIFRG